jgi:hypothetical protein
VSTVERGSPEWQRRVAAHLDEIRAGIAANGFIIQPVFSAAGQPGFQWAYTIGLTEQCRPELACTGLPAEACAALLAHVVNVDADVGGDVLHLPAEGDTPAVTFKLRAVQTMGADYPLGMAVRIYGADLVRAVQLVWPDDDGLYPDDPRWDENRLGPQPLLPTVE